MQVPYFISPPIITIPEITWHTIGTRLSEGNTMYVNIYHPTGILSSGVYWLLAKVFHENYFIPRLFAIILIFIQASLFNFIMLNYKAYNQNTYVPSLTYVLTMIAIPNFNVLSPQLMGMFFILLSMDLIFKHIEGRHKPNWIVLRLGIYLGLASLFYSSYYILLFSTLLSFILFSNTPLRKYLLVIIGFAFPYLLIWLKYFWFNEQFDFYLNLRYLLIPGNPFVILSWKSLTGIMLIPLLFFLFSFYKASRTSAFINYQVRLQNFMLFMFLAGIVIVMSDYYRASYVLIVFVPAIAFYLTHYFLLIRKRFRSEIIFLLFLVLILIQNYGISTGRIHDDQWLNIKEQIYQDQPDENLPSGKRILVLGKHQGEYYHNRLATPYLSWVVTNHQFSNLDLYKTVIKVYKNFSEDLPEIIIDKENCIPRLFYRIPELSNRYYSTGGGIYKLRQ